MINCYLFQIVVPERNSNVLEEHLKECLVQQNKFPPSFAHTLLTNYSPIQGQSSLKLTFVTCLTSSSQPKDCYTVVAV